MTNDFRGKIDEIAYLPSFVALAFRDGLEYWNADDDGRINNGNDSPNRVEIW